MNLLPAVAAFVHSFLAGLTKMSGSSQGSMLAKHFYLSHTSTGREWCEGLPCHF